MTLAKAALLEVIIDSRDVHTRNAGLASDVGHRNMA